MHDDPAAITCQPCPSTNAIMFISTRNKQVAPALWDLNRHRLVGRLDGHIGRVFTARFVSGDKILTAGGDGTARLWDAATGQPRLSVYGGSHFLADVALAPDGSVIVAGGSDGYLRFWDASTGRLLWRLHAHKSYVVGVHYEGTDIITRGFAGDVSRWVLPHPDGVVESCHAGTCESAKEAAQ